jgi:hypothetical protein
MALFGSHHPLSSCHILYLFQGGLIIIQRNLSKPNLLWTKCCVRNRQVLGLYSRQVLGLYSRQVLGLYSRLVFGLCSRQVLGLYSRQVLGLCSRQVIGLYSRQVLGLYSRQVLGLYSRHVLGIYSKIRHAIKNGTVKNRKLLSNEDKESKIVYQARRVRDHVYHICVLGISILSLFQRFSESILDRGVLFIYILL